jgi:hypothetical protein
MWAIMIHASAEAMNFSKSSASLRHLPSHAKGRSTNDPSARWDVKAVRLDGMSDHLMISNVQRPIFSSRRFSLSPA